jgi:methyl-accepting chemotaxis protein
MNRLGTRILAIVVALLLASSGIVAFYALRVSTEQMTAGAANYERALAKATAEQLNDTFDRFSGILVAMNALVRTRINVTAVNIGVLDVLVGQFAAGNGKFISDLGVQAPEISDIFVYFNPELTKKDQPTLVNFARNKDKGIFMFSDKSAFSSKELLDRKNAATNWFWTCLDTKKDFWGDPYVRDGMELVNYSMPVVNAEGSIMAVIGMTFDYAFVRKAVGDVKIYKTGYAFMLNQDMRYIAHPTLKFDGPTLREISGGIFKGLADRMLKEKRGREDYTFEGQDKTMTFETLKNGYIVSMATIREESMAGVAQIRNAVLVGSAVILAIAIIIMFFFARSLVKPLESAVKQAKKIAETGDLSEEVRVDTSIVEIRQVAEAVNEMIRSVDGTVRSILDVARRTLTRAQDLSAAAEESEASAKEVLEMANRALRNAQDSAAAVEQTNAGAEEVSAGAQSGAKAAAAASERTAEIAKATEKGGDAVDQMANLITQVNASGEQVGSAIAELSNTVSGISGFVATITQIADQTNLLALNAAIEAARAGEAGRGFAVVAEEVRKLAEDSNRAASEVGKLIGDISGRTDAATRDQKGSAEKVKQLVDRARETKSAIDDVVAKVSVISENVQSIAATMQEQSASSQEMTAGMDHVAKSGQEIAEQMEAINASMKEQSHATESIAESAQEMVALGEELQKAVARFTLAEQRSAGLVAS